MTRCFKGYKAFDANMRCLNDYQYTLGKSHKHTGPVCTGKSGLHFCESMMELLLIKTEPNLLFGSVIGSGVVDNSTYSHVFAASQLDVVRLLDGEMFEDGNYFLFDNGRLVTRRIRRGYQYYR